MNNPQSIEFSKSPSDLKNQNKPKINSFLESNWKKYLELPQFIREKENLQKSNPPCKNYQCKNRLYNQELEKSLESQRKNLEKEIFEYKIIKNEILNEINSLTTEINDLNIDIDVLENYDKFYNIDGTVKKKLDIHENLMKKKSKRIDYEIQKLNLIVF